MLPRHCNRLRESSSYGFQFEELIFLQSSHMQIGMSSKNSTKKGVVEQVRVHLPATPLILKNPVPHNQGSWLVLMDWDTIKITWMIPGRVCSRRVCVSFVVHAMRNVRRIVEKRPWNNQESGNVRVHPGLKARKSPGLRKWTKIWIAADRAANNFSHEFKTVL